MTSPGGEKGGVRREKREKGGEKKVEHSSQFCMHSVTSLAKSGRLGRNEPGGGRGGGKKKKANIYFSSYIPPASEPDESIQSGVGTGEGWGAKKREEKRKRKRGKTLYFLH